MEAGYGLVETPELPSTYLGNRLTNCQWLADLHESGNDLQFILPPDRINVLNEVVEERRRIEQEPSIPKELAATISFEKDPVAAGDNQTITFVAFDQYSGERLPNSSVGITVVFEKGITKSGYGGRMNENGEYSFELRISEGTEPQSVKVTGSVSAEGYGNRSIEREASFEVVSSY